MDSHVLCVASSGVLLIGGDVENGTRFQRQILVTLGVTSSDLGALGVQSNGNLASGLNLLCLASIVDDGLMILVRAVGEVHAHNVETRFSQPVDGLDRVGLGSNGADDGGTTIVALGLVGSVQGR
jgi:hypothetical protein